jgi:non-specific serine/threonine protein kinase
MAVFLSPKGVLHFDAGAAGDLDARVADGLGSAAEKGSAALLLHLATRHVDVAMPPVESFWRAFARRYFTALCHTDDPLVLGEIAPPGPPVLEEIAASAPPMTGAEYLGGARLESLWRELNDLVFAGIRSAKEGAQGWLKQQNPVWNLVGRVTFHLAENKKSGAHPFAFLATYTHRISDQATPQYLPLGRAFDEFSGAGNRQALLSLLAPVQRASAKSEFVRGLVESKRVYQPQVFTAREAHQFLQEIPAFEEAGLLVRVPAWGRPVRPKVNVTVGAGKPAGVGLDALMDFRAELTLDGEPVSEAEWKALTSGTESLVQIRGRWVEVDREKINEVLAHWKSLEKARIEGGVSFAEAMRLLSGGSVGSADDAPDTVREWTGIQAGPWLEQTLEKLRDPASAGPVPGLHAELRPYQSRGVHWLNFVTGLGLGACLADDMGLGKTIQVLGALLQWRKAHPHDPPAFLVLPASLIGNWIAEAARFAPSLRLRALHPSVCQPGELAAAEKAKTFRDTDIVLTTYGMLGKQEWLTKQDWSFVILDEAQAIKNPSTRQAKSVKALRGARRIALTGTPVENSLGDLWSLFDFLNPGLLGTGAEFSRHAKKIARGEGGYGPLRRLVRPYILRRLKSDKSVIADLPDKTEVRTFCSLTKRQAALYEQSVRELADRLETVNAIQRRGVVLAFLMRFKQLCNHPAQWLGNGDYDPLGSGKFLRLAGLCEEIAARQEKVLVFTQFKEITAPLEHFLATQFKRPGLVLHGETSVKARQALVERFQREDGPPFFILSLKAGGTGLTLTEAAHVIHFDRWWNPAVENQATDRAYRIGQKKNVLVHKFVCRGTVEEKIDQMLLDKRELAGGVLSDGGEVPLTEMSDKALLDFVALDARSALED